jgi:aryl-alcohol dehydrogenase-like predicted oxidoreductase
MDYTTLGRTDLRVSVLGLGGGGHSRLGQRAGASAKHSASIVRHALGLGVTFFDTAEAYRTEAFVGEGLRGHSRGQVVISTKKSPTADGRPISATELRQGLEASLARLRTDYIDIYHLHGVRDGQYDRARDELAPELLKLRDQGTIRFLGITEAFGADTGHAMLRRAVLDDLWDVVMVGFNILNQSARERVLAETRQRGIGVLCMFAVRDALSRPEKLRETVGDLVRQGVLDAGELDLDDPLGFVRAVAASVPDAAYRFCRAEPGIDVVLSGTGNIDHLEENVASILAPPLPANIYQRLVDLFQGLDTVSAQ